MGGPGVTYNKQTKKTILDKYLLWCKRSAFMTHPESLDYYYQTSSIAQTSELTSLPLQFNSRHVNKTGFVENYWKEN